MPELNDLAPLSDLVTDPELKALHDQKVFTLSRFTLALDNNLLKIGRHHSPNCQCPACCN
jgi:hypothetical protein